jgi:hypothetical protein
MSAVVGGDDPRLGGEAKLDLGRGALEILEGAAIQWLS